MTWRRLARACSLAVGLAACHGGRLNSGAAGTCGGNDGDCAPASPGDSAAPPAHPKTTLGSGGQGGAGSQWDAGRARSGDGAGGVAGSNWDASQPIADADTDTGSPREAGPFVYPPAIAAQCPDGEPDAGSSSAHPRWNDASSAVTTVVDAKLVRVPVSARTLASHPLRSRLYALADAGDPAYADQLVIIDSESGAILDSLSVGADPTTIAISDDGSTLWVGSRAGFQLRAVDLSGARPVWTESYALPPEWAAMASSLVVALPAQGSRPPTLIDLRDGAGTFVGQVTLSQGAALASASGSTTTRVCAGPPGWFFAYNDFDSGFQFYSADARSGSVTLNEHYGLVAGYGRRIFYDPDGFVYASSGQVIDVRDPSAPRKVGQLAASGWYLPVAGSDRVLVVADDSTQDELVTVVDKRTFTRLGALRGRAGEVLSSPVLLGPDRVAFVAGGPLGSSIYLTNAVPTAAGSDRVLAVAHESENSLQLELRVRALAADPFRHMLYAAVGGGAPRYENRVVAIDPQRGEIVGSLFVGSNPIELALSDDGSVLWVSLADSSGVRRIDLSCGYPIVLEALALPVLGRAFSLVPLPGHPGSVAALIDATAQLAGPIFTGIAFFDDGVPRSNFFDRFFGASSMVAGPAGVIFSHEPGGAGFYTVRYDEGKAEQRSTGVLASGGSTALAYDPDGFVYFTSGDIVDVRDPLAPKREGKLEVGGATLAFAGSSTLTLAGNQLRLFDAETHALLASHATGCGYSSLNPIDLVHVAPGRVAFITPGLSAFDPGDSVCIVSAPELIP